MSELDADARVRIRLARALALEPKVLLLEHATAGLSLDASAVLGTDIRRIATRRGCALIAITADPQFASAVAGTVLTLDPASGRLSAGRRHWSLFRRSE